MHTLTSADFEYGFSAPGTPSLGLRAGGTAFPP